MRGVVVHAWAPHVCLGHARASFTSFSDAKAAVQAQWEGMLGRVTVGTDSSTSSTDVVSHSGRVAL